MPWSEVSIMDQRREFVQLAMQEGANIRELCRRFGVHPDIGYKWLGRWTSGEGLADRSRRPHSSPAPTDDTGVHQIGLTDWHDTSHSWRPKGKEHWRSAIPLILGHQFEPGPDKRVKVPYTS